MILSRFYLGIGFLISAALAGFGLDPTKIQTDRIITVYNTNGLLTSFLRFTQTGQGKWRTVLGATTLIGRIFSLVTINLFLPPSQLLVHPFLRFYSTTPRSPALHYAIAKQVNQGSIYSRLRIVLSSKTSFPESVFPSVKTCSSIVGKFAQILLKSNLNYHKKYV